MPPFSILQVCMGNICRSPMAERLLVLAARRYVGARCPELLLVHGAGTGGWHVGSAMDPGAARQVRARGGDPDGFAARKVRGDMLEASDLILTATGDQLDFVVEMRPDAADRTFVLGEFGRLLAAVDLSVLPPLGSSRPSGGSGESPSVPDADAVYARGVALVEAVAKARNGRPPRPEDDLDDPWGRGERYFGRVADSIDATVRPLARALLVG